MTTWVVVAFTAAAILALLVLYFNGLKAWYWHVLSGIAAIIIGLVPTPPSLNTATASLVVGFVFVFLMTWAVAAPFVGGRRRSR